MEPRYRLSWVFDSRGMSNRNQPILWFHNISCTQVQLESDRVFDLFSNYKQGTLPYISLIIDVIPAPTLLLRRNR
jgi:hypothetical protein